MSDITRRNKTVPVQASRVPPGPEAINIPGMGPMPVPPPQAGVTQNIIYVNVPAGQPAASTTPPPQQPSEVHLHTHVHEYPRRRRSGRHGVSFLGTLGFVLGGVACGACYAPPLIWLAKPIAMVAALCAGLGLINAIVFRKVGRGMPLLGLISAGMGYWMWMIHSGQARLQLPKQFDAINNLVAPTPTAPAQSPAAPAVVPEATAPAPVQQPPRDPSIFGDHARWGNSSKTPASPTTPAPNTPLQTTPLPTTPASVTPAVSAVDVATATANLESVRVTAAQKLGLNYVAVKSAADDARAEYEQIRQTSSPGSPELIGASQTRMDADAKLQQMQAQLRSDPAVAAAEAVLKSAKSAGR